MADKVLMKGNEAIGEAAVRAGCRYYFAYPITPQNEIPAYMAKRLPEVGGTFLQAVSHELHSVQEQSQTSHKGYNIKNVHTVFLFMWYTPKLNTPVSYALNKSSLVYRPENSIAEINN